MTKGIAGLLVITVLALGLTSCGKKGAPVYKGPTQQSEQKKSNG